MILVWNVLLRSVRGFSSGESVAPPWTIDCQRPVLLQTQSTDVTLIPFLFFTKSTLITAASLLHTGFLLTPTSPSFQQDARLCPELFLSLPSLSSLLYLYCMMPPLFSQKYFWQPWGDAAYGFSLPSSVLSGISLKPLSYMCTQCARIEKKIYLMNNKIKYKAKYLNCQWDNSCNSSHLTTWKQEMFVFLSQKRHSLNITQLLISLLTMSHLSYTGQRLNKSWEMTIWSSVYCLKNTLLGLKTKTMT